MMHLLSIGAGGWPVHILPPSVLAQEDNAPRSTEQLTPDLKRSEEL